MVFAADLGFGIHDLVFDGVNIGYDKMKAFGYLLNEAIVTYVSQIFLFQSPWNKIKFSYASRKFSWRNNIRKLVLIISIIKSNDYHKSVTS